MSVSKFLRFSNQTKAILKTQSPIYRPFPPSPPFIARRTLHSSPQKPTKKPLSLLFQGAVGLTERAEKNELIRGLKESKGEVRELKEKTRGKKKETEGVQRGKPKKVKSLIELFGGQKREEKVEKMVKVDLGKELTESKENPREKRKEKKGVEKGKPKKVKSLIEMFGGKKKEEMVGKMMKVERGKEVRNLKENPREKMKEKEGVEKGKPKKVESSIEMFAEEKKEEKVKKMVKVRRERKDVRVLKGLSPLAETFIRHLQGKGYFNKANFLEVDKPELVYFDNSYSRTFIKFAAVEFGKDHQEIARWLSGNHLKKVVLFGCPSLDKYDIFAAKRLRKFFKIQENTVCNQCVLKNSCKYANKSVWGIGTKSLVLADVMKVTALYAVDFVPPELTVPDEVKESVNQLLEEVIKLSQPS
ncbi:hypothetical protein PTKIN_Ptkin14bG0179500 [Pterospermum kingtungense]